MFNLDLRTVYLNFILTEIISFIFIVILWNQNRKRMDGVGYFVLHFLFQLLCVILIYLRGVIPDFVSIVLPNALSLVSILFILIGFERITGKKIVIR